MWSIYLPITAPSIYASEMKNVIDLYRHVQFGLEHAVKLLARNLHRMLQVHKMW